jgi:hypothetical protein
MHQSLECRQPLCPCTLIPGSCSTCTPSVPYLQYTRELFYLHTLCPIPSIHQGVVLLFAHLRQHIFDTPVSCSIRLGWLAVDPSRFGDAWKYWLTVDPTWPIGSQLILEILGNIGSQLILPGSGILGNIGSQLILLGNIGSQLILLGNIGLQLILEILEISGDIGSQLILPCLGILGNIPRPTETTGPQKSVLTFPW